MKKSFTEHPFFEAMGTLGDLAMLNLLFILSALPVVSIGVSLTALYRVTLDMAEGESAYPLREFVQAYKKSWKRGLPLGLFFLCSGVLLVFDIWYVQRMWKGLYVGIGILLLLWMFVFCYAFALQAVTDYSLPLTLYQSFLLSLKYLPFTLCMVLLNLLPVWALFAGNFVSGLVPPFFLFCSFALTARLESIMLKRVFRVFEKEEDEDSGES